MDFSATEAREGVRFTWNNLPRGRSEAAQNVIPIAALYTPFAALEEPIQRCATKPIICSGCQWVANAFCQFDAHNGNWECINCKASTPLHTQYRDQLRGGQNLPEMQTGMRVIEYKLGPSAALGWIFVVDLCIPASELAAVKAQIIAAMSRIERANVGIVAFSKHAIAYDLVSQFVCENIVPGGVEYTPERLREILGLKLNESETAVSSRFVQPIATCRERVIQIVSRMRSDDLDLKEDRRKTRATGQGLSLATVLAESFHGSGSRITAFLGGPCTSGPGKVVGTDFAERFRTRDDFEKDTTKIVTFRKAQRHYEALSERLVYVGATVDVFAFCLDEFGAAEMRCLIEKTGGTLIHQEEFTMEVFAQSFEKYLNYRLEPMSPHNCRLSVKTTSNLFICGALGPLKLTKKDKSLYGDADILIGESGGDEFFIGSPMPSATFCFFFSPSTSENKAPKSTLCHFQFQVIYATSAGEKIMRVATFYRPWAADRAHAVAGFDQEAATVTVARMAVQKAETLDSNDLVLWLNSVLIKLVRRFATFSPGIPESFRNAPEILLVPQYMYYFRRSAFVQKALTSVDEQAVGRLNLNRETVSNTLVMIQPTLVSYELGREEATPVFCDVDSLRADVVILVDTYFYVLVWHGRNVHSWVESGYHEQPEYAGLKTILELPMQDAALILEDRFPVPQFVVCYQGSPNERLIKSRLTPTNSQASASNPDEENYITDDTSLSTFMQYLIKLVVKPS